MQLLQTYRQRACPASSSAFSLIELLVVMAIIVLMMSLVSRGLKGTSSASLSGEGERVSALISLARQSAMTKNALTALIIVTDPQSDGSFRAISLWEALPRPDGTTPVPGDWKQLTKWDRIRTGVVFTPPALDPPSKATNPAFPQFKYGGVTLDQASGFACKIFLPSGGLLGGQHGAIKLAEGFVTAKAPSPSYTNKNNAGEPANTYTITIIAATGHSVIERP